MASKDKKTVRSTSGGSRPAGGFRTLADLNRRSTPDSDSDSDNPPQEYYTGGEKRFFLFLFLCSFFVFLFYPCDFLLLIFDLGYVLLYFSCLRNVSDCLY